MFLLEWYRQWLTIRAEFKAKKFELTREVTTEQKICQSCETLKQQLEIANYEKKQLLDRLLFKPSPEAERTVAPEPTAVRPRSIPWHVRRQMLETEDREKARALKDAAKPDSANQTNQKVDVEELERELNVAEKARESESNA
jgi:hypothetical protein